MTVSLSDLAIRAAGDPDADALRALHQRVFGRLPSSAKWGWKLSPRSAIPNVWIAEHGGRIVFQYAGIPTRFRHRGDDVWAMVSVDTMCDPDFRRRGLLGHVAARTYERWREAGVPFVIGLPNEQWGSRTALLGWKPIAELRWWVRWLDPIALIAARLGLPFGLPPSAAKRRMAREDLRPIHDAACLDGLWKEVAEEGVVRDSAWFSWRYLQDVPPWRALSLWRKGTVVGAVAFHRDETSGPASGRIGEIVAVDRAAQRSLLRAASEELRALGAARAAVLIQSGSSLEESALATGFLPRPATFQVQGVDLGGHLPWAATFQGGDFDVV